MGKSLRLIWHDHAVWTGVTRCLNELQTRGELGDIRRIDGTTMGIARF
jgi:hypothetical protein